MTQPINRGTFHKQAAAMSALAALPSTHLMALGSNERVRLGVIGVGNRGDQLLDALLVNKDCEIAALCDVYEPYLDAAQKKVGGKATLYHDFRKLIEQKDLDAIVIATPDHWHALQFVEACRAGKDVYVEKPLSLTIGEGRKMVAVAEETRRVTQVGLHRRSSRLTSHAPPLIPAGGPRQIRDTMEVIWEYEGGTLVTMSQYNANTSPGNARGWEIEFRGTKGTLLMQEGAGYEIIPEKNRTRELPALSPLHRKEDTEQAR